jgi:hypothetical protein
MDKTEINEAEFWRYFASRKNTVETFGEYTFIWSRINFVFAKLGKDWQYVNKQHGNFMWRYLISGRSVRWSLGNNIRLRSPRVSQL